MVQLSAPWVADGSAVRAAIEAELMLSGLMPKLTAAHAGIVAVSAQANDPEARKLMSEATRLDTLQDDLVCSMQCCTEWLPGGCLVNAADQKMAGKWGICAAAQCRGDRRSGTRMRC